jgi:hypothetical protein
MESERETLDLERDSMLILNNFALFNESNGKDRIVLFIDTREPMRKAKVRVETSDIFDSNMTDTKEADVLDIVERNKGLIESVLDEDME